MKPDETDSVYFVHGHLGNANVWLRDRLGKIKLKTDDSVLVGEEDDIAYMMAAGATNALSCACDAKGGSCKVKKDQIGMYCESTCTGRCWGTIKKPPSSVVFELYRE